MKKKLVLLAHLPGNFRFYFLLVCSLVLSAIAYGQNVTGTVTDGTTPLAGVTIQVKGKTAATATNNAGQFTVTASGTDVLVVSSIGFVSQEIGINGRSSLTINLATDAQNLNEVVITALGITKESRRIGYAATNVKPEELTVNRTANPINALQGKVAGLNISTLGTGPAGSSKIRLRGQSSFAGQGSPLIVINGVPINNTNFGVNTTSGAPVAGEMSARGGGVTSDGGDGLTSINPDDIESMTVLKGAPAAALYGNRASSGVIMITTKSKGKAKGIGIAYNVNYTNETPLDFTDYQTEWGQGENGLRPSSPNPTSGQWSFGDSIRPGMTHILFDGLVVPYELQGSRIKEFYRNGQNLSNTVTLSANSEKGGLHLSIANMDNKGIMPNNKFNRKSINLGFNYSLSTRFTFFGNANYSNETNKNPPNIANQDNSIPTTLMALANTMPLSVLEANKYNAQGNEYIYSRFMNRTNPYWVLAEQFNNIRRDRIFGNVGVKYNFFDWLYIQGRAGMDYWSRDQDYNNFPTGHASRPAAPAGFVNGLYTQEARTFRETNIDFLASATRQFGDFGANLTVGGNQRRSRDDLNSVQVTDFVVRGLYTVQNGRAKDPTYARAEIGVNSIYGSAEFSYKRALYLNGTLRRDIFSTLSEADRAFNYPSVSLSYVFSEHFKPSWLTYGKIRAGYASVGSDNDIAPSSDQLFYSINANLINNSAGVAVPVGGIIGTTLPNAGLVPMSIDEIEVGLELKLFQSRVNLDIAAYNKITKDQIVSAQVSDASGFVDTRINSGKSRNRGIEVLLNVLAIQKKDFLLEFTANTSYNMTKVLSIGTSIAGESITTATHVFNGEVRQVVGKEMGQIAGFGYNTNTKGERIHLGTGVPQRTPGIILFGSALPNWVGGFTTSIDYKGIRLSVLIDYKLGNKMLSGTNFNAVRHGLHKMTLLGRDSGFVVGVGVGPDATTPNAVKTPVQTYWEHLRTQALIESVVFNGGYWKLRQITLGYDLTKFIPAKWPIKGLRLDLVANNVAILKKWVDNIDPETFGYTSDNLVGLESPGLPSTRAMGLNLNIKF
jgi:TonB-linked SusC/RagA family outer membrane protein